MSNVNRVHLYLTPGRVKSFVGVVGPGGYKIYLTDGSRGWVELGGGGATGNPHKLPRQPLRGFSTESEAWQFAKDLVSSNAELAQSPLKFHRLYKYAPTGELYHDRAKSFASLKKREIQSSSAKRTRNLLKASEIPTSPRRWDKDLIDIALTIDGYKLLGDDLGEFSNHVKTLHETYPKLLDGFSVTGLRMLLFYEQRRARWLVIDEVDVYTRAVIARLRKLLPD